MLALRAARAPGHALRLVRGRTAARSTRWSGAGAARGPAVRGLCAPAQGGDDSEEPGETLLYDNYRPVRARCGEKNASGRGSLTATAAWPAPRAQVFANVVLAGTVAHTGFWVWAIKMNEKITEIREREASPGRRRPVLRACRPRPPTRPRRRARAAQHLLRLRWAGGERAHPQPGGAVEASHRGAGRPGRCLQRPHRHLRAADGARGHRRRRGPAATIHAAPSLAPPRE